MYTKALDTFSENSTRLHGHPQQSLPWELHEEGGPCFLILNEVVLWASLSFLSLWLLKSSQLEGNSTEWGVRILGSHSSEDTFWLSNPGQDISPFWAICKNVLIGGRLTRSEKQQLCWAWQNGTHLDTRHYQWMLPLHRTFAWLVGLCHFRQRWERTCPRSHS